MVRGRGAHLDDTAVHHLLEKQEMKAKEVPWKTGIKHENSLSGVVLTSVPSRREVHSSILVISFPDGQGRGQIE